MAKKPENLQLAVRLTPEQAAQLDELEVEISKRSLGAEIGRGHVARLALDLGMPALAKRLSKEATK